MKLTMFLGAFGGLCLVTTSPLPTDLAANPAHTPVNRVTRLSWKPPNAYKTQGRRKKHWEHMCGEVLAREGCAVGVIHKGQSRMTRPNGVMSYYVNLEAAPSMDMMENAKKIRVFEDGSSENLDKWPRRNERWIQKSRRKRKDAWPEQHAVLHWNPANAYENHQQKKEFWEQKCDEALAREGCEVGLIHQGRSKMPKTNGDLSHYLNVEGAPSADMMGNAKKIRVFEDGSSETLEHWPQRDRKIMEEAKRFKKGPGPNKVHQTFLFWDPAESYQKTQEKRRLFWEQKCDAALAREGCGLGLVHRGQSTQVKNGRKTTYINVMGAQLTNFEHVKKLRVYQDASSKDFTKTGWTDSDRKAIAKAKYHQVLTQERTHTQDRSKHRISWDPPNAYGKFSHSRAAHTRLCDQALSREECDFGIIRKGRHLVKKPDGSTLYYLTVSAGKQSDPENTRTMRLYQDGTSEWYSSAEERQREGSAQGPKLLPKRPRGRPKKGTGSITQTQGTSITTSQAPTQAANLAQFQSPGQVGNQYTSKRRRVEGDDHQFSGA